MDDINKKYTEPYKRNSSSLLPREKLVKSGLHSLSDVELLTILLGSGVKGNSIFSISRELLQILDSKTSSEINLKELMNIPGLGKAKAMCILSALEIGRRRFIPRKWQIKSPLEVLPLLVHYSDRNQECFIVITLNGANEVLSKHVISIGLLNRTLVHPREVFTVAVRDHAASIILAHNHPSGNVNPSAEDKEVTRILVEAGQILDIIVLDHIIFYTTEFFSFYGEGILSFNTNKDIKNSAATP